MHEAHWHLKQPAFETNADPAFYFPSRTHEGALLKLRYLVEHRKGVGLLAGGHGSGKTYLTFRLAEELGDERYRFARIGYPKLGADELLRDIAARLGVPGLAEPIGSDGVLRAIEARLADLAAEGRQAVLIIDEAHLLETEQLQTLQLLLNLQEGGRTGVSLLLVGHLELLPRVGRAGGLESRVAARAALSPLSPAETAEYVRHRLRIAGQEVCPFSDEALRSIAELSQGVPRRINQICDLALLIGFADARDGLSPVDVEAAAAELAGTSAE